ncbi:MAG: bud neck involved protein [Icmadophila ericetorum]|nr:bud neck involved protein [Icmadophila ericetorum]
MGPTSYRGHTSSPIAPYAFTTAPTLANSNPLRQHPTTPHLRPENRALSAPVIPYTQQASANNAIYQARQRHSNIGITTIASADSSITTSNQQASPRDDSVISLQRPLSSIELNATDLGSPTSSKPSPDRYRRIQRRPEMPSPTVTSPTGGSALPSGSGMTSVSHLYNQPVAPMSPVQSYRGTQASYNQENISSYGIPPRSMSKDDMVLQRQPSDLAKRYRRRSVSGIESGEPETLQLSPREQFANTQARSYAAVVANSHVVEPQVVKQVPEVLRPSSSHGRNGSDESNISARNPRPSASKRDSGGELEVAIASPTAIQATPIARHEAKIINIPARGSSDTIKRLSSPSPLSKPMTMTPEPPSNISPPPSQPRQEKPSTLEQPASSSIANTDSPAAQHLAALNKKEAKKEGKSSRLRRAFSFGSAAELRKASAENSHQKNESTKLKKDQFRDEREAEQAAIVQKQEAAGLGEGIYSGQGHFFTGSTDNLSISSTASSASIMIRKMGKGMKKSTRSLVGLFRPKSVIGVPAADSAVPEPSLAQVSMVTVEAEREKVNVNLDPHDQAGGGTGFPKLERNSIDTSNVSTIEPALSLADKSVDHDRPRQSIVGGEKERAEVLAAVKKGILKRSGTDSGNSSPVQRPVDSHTSSYILPQIPHFNDSPTTSAPSTPSDEHLSRAAHRRTDSVTIEGEDYFMSIARFANSDSKSLPGTPRSMTARNIHFSPRIQFHDTWPSGEYDRRGEIATCNRLTPLLAQQIKEELNTFKMEMEVHEQSKVYTHFF